MLARQTILAERFEYSPGNVRARWIEHGVVIGKRNLAQKLPVVIDIESRPSAVFALHGEQPVDGALLACLLLNRVGSASAAQGEKDHSRVVNVGIELIGEFEAPARWFYIGPLYAPIAATPNLFR